MDINEMTERLKVVRAQRIAEETTLVKSVLRNFMGAHPEVAFLQFKTYTPGFNDGDPCEFTITGPEVKLTGDGEKGEIPPEDLVVLRDDDEDYEEDEGDDDDEESEFKCYYSDAVKAHPTLVADLKSLEGFFEVSEDAIEELFGDGSKITIGRNGKAKVESYDCGY